MTSTPARTASGPPAEVTPRQALTSVVRQNRQTIDRLLRPTRIDGETFLAQLDVAVRQTPALLACDIDSVLGGMLQSARYGLAPNDGQNLAWILPRKVQGRQVAIWQLGYEGIIALAQRNGVSFSGAAVFPGDDFDLDLAHPETLRHVPAYARKPRATKRGELAFAWWVRAQYPDGRVFVFSLDRAQVERDHRRHSDAPNSPMWTKWYDAAAQKSVVKEMRKYLPTVPALSSAMAADGTAFDLHEMAEDHVDVDPQDLEVGPPSEPETEPVEWDPDDPGRPFDPDDDLPRPGRGGIQP